MQYGAMGLILILAASFTSAADANCRWEVHGRIEGVRAPIGNIPGESWAAANLQVRVQARTPGGLWNQPNWPGTQTDEQGMWSVTSLPAFPDPDCQNRREFRVQILTPLTSNSWRTVYHQTVTGPTGMGGIHTPAPVHSTALGLLILREDGGSENGVIRIEGLPENFEPVDMTGVPPTNAPDDTQIHQADPAPTTGQVDGSAPALAEIPCGMMTQGLPGRVEFRFGQLPSTPGPISSDAALHTETRTNGPGTMTLNRLRNHILVENAGSRDYHARDDCPAIVQFRINEGPGRRGNADEAWSLPATVEIPDLAVNATAALNRTANLLGSGDIFEGEWAEQWYGGAGNSGFYEYALIEVTLDATHNVFEAGEGDNTVIHCYHAPERRFVDIALCQSE